MSAQLRKKAFSLYN